MSDIPEARNLVARARVHISRGNLAAADRLLEKAEQLMFREPYGKPKAPREAKPITPALKAQILADVRANPRLSIKKLAVKYDTGTGRISEVINGLR